MRIVSILLEGFLRFPLRDGVSFYHEFGHKLTMFAGRNGSGKSSLLNELSPLPSDKSNFCNKKGFKKIVIEKDNNIYTLISDFRGKVSYSFLLNDEELNTANLITAQRELVYKHFGITQVIHELMVDQEHFCTMSLVNRKKLFSSITHLNIDSVLDGYNKLREELKNNQLLLKTTTSNLLSEEQKLLSPEQQELNKQNLLNLKTHTDNLLELRTGLQRCLSTGSDEGSYKQGFEVKTLLKTTFKRSSILLTAYPFKDLPKYKEKNTARLSSNQTKLNTFYTQLEEKHKELSLLETNSLANRNVLVERLNNLIQLKEKLTESLRFFKDPNEVTTTTYNALYKLEASLPELLRNLQTNCGFGGEKIYTVEKYNNHLDQKKNLVEELQNLNATEISIKNNVKQIESTDGNINCPNCNHTWPIKDALLASQHREEELQSILAKQNVIRGEMRRVESYIEEVTEYFGIYRQVVALRKETQEVLKPLWDVVAAKDLIFQDPSSIVPYINLVGLDLTNIQEILNYQKEIDYLTNEIETMTVIETSSQEHVLNAIEYLTQEVNDLQLEKQHLQEEATNIRTAESLYATFTSLSAKLDTSLSNVRLFNMDTLVRDLTNIIDDELRSLRITIINLEKEQHHIETVQYGISKYQKEIDDLQENIKVLELAIKELCPKTGLIAKSVSSFLNTIILNVNSTVDRIWDYKMLLKEIDVGTDPLNYKFKVTVEDALEVSDVSVISSGMKEIIDIAFKQVLYRLLGFDNYPFFLDEAGAKLDSQHRGKYFNMLSSFISNSNYGQIFMITHIDTSIATYREVEVVEL